MNIISEYYLTVIFNFEYICSTITQQKYNMNTTNKEAYTHAEVSLSERLQKAYKRISPNLTALARRDFCEAHQVADQTFRAKRSGAYTVTEQECEWLEAYKPYVSA